MKSALCVLSCAVLLGACVGSPTLPTPPVPSQKTQSDDLRPLLDYAASLRGRSAAELSLEGEALAKAYALHHSETNRLRLAIFHALTPGGDRARAQSLLDCAPGEGCASGRNHALAVLLLPLLQENRRLGDSVDAAQQRLREEQKRSDTLQQKLDAIRNIEKQMIERKQDKTP